MTFQDLDKIPGLSRPWKMCLSNSMTFHDFPGPVATLDIVNKLSTFHTFTIYWSLWKTVAGWSPADLYFVPMPAHTALQRSGVLCREKSHVPSTMSRTSPGFL